MRWGVLLELTLQHGSARPTQLARVLAVLAPTCTWAPLALPTPCPHPPLAPPGAYRSEGTRHLAGWTHFRPAEAEQPNMLVAEEE